MSTVCCAAPREREGEEDGSLSSGIGKGIIYESERWTCRLNEFLSPPPPPATAAALNPLEGR